MSRKVFVGKIPYKVTSTEFEEYWKAIEGVENCHVILSPSNPGENKGFGFVICATSEIAKQISEQTHELGGTTLDVKVNEPKPERYHVKLEKNVEESAVKEYFENLGEITDIYVQSEKQFAFVTIKLTDEGMDLKNMTHEGIATEVSKAGKRRTGGSGRGRGRGGRGRGRGRGGRGRGGWGMGGRGGGFGGNPYGHPGMYGNPMMAMYGGMMGNPYYNMQQNYNPY